MGGIRAKGVLTPFSTRLAVSAVPTSLRTVFKRPMMAFTKKIDYSYESSAMNIG